MTALRGRHRQAAVAAVVLLCATAPGQTESASVKKLALRLIVAERPAEALVLLATARAHAPRDPQLLVFEGEALYQLDQNQKAVDAFRAAIAIDPAIAAHVPNLGNALLRLRRVAEARTQFETIAAGAPNAPAKSRALVGVGLALAEEGDEKGARAKYEEAVRVDPASLRARYRLGLAQLAAEEYAAALANLGVVVAVDPLYEGAVYNLAMTRRAVNDPAAAATWDQFKAVRKAKREIEDLKLALRASPEEGALVLALARVYATAGSNTDAATWFQRYLDLVPHDAAARKQLDAVRERASSRPTR